MSARLLALAALALLALNIYLGFAIFAAPARVQHLSQQGSATLVTLPGGHAVLVGAGPDASIVRALGEALPPWQRHLDALLLRSSAHTEAGGAPFVEARYHVGTVRTIPPEAGLVLTYKNASIEVR